MIIKWAISGVSSNMSFFRILELDAFQTRNPAFECVVNFIPCPIAKNWWITLCYSTWRILSGGATRRRQWKQSEWKAANWWDGWKYASSSSLEIGKIMFSFIVTSVTWCLPNTDHIIFRKLILKQEKVEIFYLSILFWSSYLHPLNLCTILWKRRIFMQI